MRLSATLAAALAVAGCLGLGVAGIVHSADYGRTADRPSAAPVVPISVHSSPAPVGRCSTPAPISATGYQRMFASVPTSEWGAADGAVSLPLPDGRVLWLYGDTFSAGRFVHSSAIVQDRGCLHVVNAGAQLLPNVDAHHIFWIESARVDRGLGVIVTGRAVTLTGTGPWDFRDGGYDQAFDFDLDAVGNVAAPPPSRYRAEAGLVWPLGPSMPSPVPDPGPMYVYGPHHFGYARHAHPEAHLASGRALITTCQNWDDGVLHPFASYRPIFSEGVPR